MLYCNILLGGFKMSSKDNMGDRMKYYESLTSQKCMRGLPVIVRLDGKSFSKFMI